MARNRRNDKPASSTWFFLILAIVVGYSCYTLYNQQVMLDALNEDAMKAADRLHNAEQIQKDLQAEIENLTKPEYVEKLARDELGMARQGELPYIYTKKQQ